MGQPPTASTDRTRTTDRAAAASYLTSPHIALQLQAIHVFITASSGSRFMGEFLEVGGVLTLLEIIGLPHAKEVGCAAAA